MISTCYGFGEFWTTYVQHSSALAAEKASFEAHAVPAVGGGKEGYINWSVGSPEQEPTVNRDALRTTGRYRHVLGNIRNCVT